MVELAKPTVLDKRYVREGIMAFNYDAILAEREAWQNELTKQHLDFTLKWAKLQAALDKVEDTIVATMKRADKAEAKCQNCPLKLLNPSERETVLQAALAKAEARVRELEAALYKKGKWNPEIDEVERILRNAIDKSLPKEARRVASAPQRPVKGAQRQ